MGQVGGSGLDPGPVGVRSGARVQRTTGQTVPVSDLDSVGPGGVERGDDRGGLGVSPILSVIGA